MAVKVEVRRNFDTSAWDIQRSGQFDAYEKVDLDTVKFTLELQPHTSKTFEYTVTLYRGVRADDFSARNR